MCSLCHCPLPAAQPLLRKSRARASSGLDVQEEVSYLPRSTQIGSPSCPLPFPCRLSPVSSSDVQVCMVQDEPVYRWNVPASYVRGSRLRISRAAKGPPSDNGGTIYAGAGASEAGCEGLACCMSLP